MKRFFTFFCWTFLGIQAAYCQLDTINNKYFSNLRTTLSKDSNVKEVKFVQKRIFHNKGIIQSMYVKYNNDQNNRYWRIGKEFIYNTSNNSLGYISNVNVQNKVLSDTSYSYNENGTLAGLYIYNLKYDSTVAIKKANSLLSAIFGNYYERIPNLYKSIEYSCNGDTITEKTYKYTEIEGFVLDGDVIYRDKQMRIIMTKRYEMGREAGLVDKCRMNVFTDNRDGKVYPTIQIGNQIWLAKNLSYKPDSGKYWTPDNDINNVAIYGYLYNWETAQNVCPSGSHLPSKEDFEILLQNEEVKGLKDNLIVTGKSGFSALFGGFHAGINYIPSGISTAFWTSSVSEKSVWLMCIVQNGSNASIYNFPKKNSTGNPVRCLLDNK